MILEIILSIIIGIVGAVTLGYFSGILFVKKSKSGGGNIIKECMKMMGTKQNKKSKKLKKSKK